MTRKPQPALFDGALVIDKPQGRTSHDVVEAARRSLGFRQIGHLGTLDPLATGVLVLLLGRATRLAQFYSGRRKRYATTFRFGFSTDTYDSDGSPLGPDLAPQLDRAAIERLAAERVGRFPQMPPPFSAKKIHGRPAHELARKHKPVELKAVDIDVFEYRLLSVEGSLARFIVECAPGTYVRSLAHDMGQALGFGAHLSEIVRTAVGEFTLDQAVKLEEFEKAAREGRAAEWILPLDAPSARTAARECAADRRAARAPRLAVQHLDCANPARQRADRPGRPGRAGCGRVEAGAASGIQSAGPADRHRGSGRPAHVPARGRPGSRGLRGSRYG